MIDLSHLKSDKPVGVFGLGVSGMASLKALREADFTVYAWDDNSGRQDEAKAMGAKVQGLSEDMPEDLDFLVLAPGVPLTHPEPHDVVKKAKLHNIEILSDIELLFRARPKATYIGITGTNGKSTTTALIGHILKSAGQRVQVGGNIGIPALSLDPLEQGEIYVLELSSYQLDLCPTFVPDIAVLLNITEDHLDRHGGMKGYAASKAQIFGDHSYNIISTDDEYCRDIAKKLPLQNTQIFTSDQQIDLTLTDLPALKGAHNIQNAMAAYYACKKTGLDDSQIEDGLRSFSGLKHRQNIVRDIDGITYINDSKATNDEAAAKALSSFDYPIHWIVGGQSKGDKYPACLPYFDRIETAYVIGEDTAALETYLSRHNVEYEICKTLETAVQKAYVSANPPATVLLSPAAASWDQYKNFEERGDHFETLVQDLP